MRSAAIRFFGTACLLASSTLLAVYAVETYLTLNDPFAAQSVSRRVEGLRQRGYDAYPAYVPAYRFKVPSGAMPLSGVRRVRTVIGSDDRSSVVYDSDEFGFRNPPGLWHPGVQLALLGDSFVQGYGVPDGRDLASIMRERYPRTLNLGMTGTGQLAQLALLREYLSPVQPSRVVVFYYEGNDVHDTSGELLDPILRRYYFDDEFTQNLVGRFDAIDAQLRTMLDHGVEQELEKEVRRAPHVAAGTTIGHIARLSAVRSLWQAALRTRGSRSSPDRAPMMGCHQRYDLLQRQLMEIDTENQTVRAVPQDPAGGRAAFSDFLSQHQLLLGRALFNVEIYLLPRDSYRSILLEMKNLVSRWGGQLSFVYLPSHVSISDARCDPNRTMIEDVVRSAGIPFIDAGVPLRSHPDPASLFVIHLTPEGCRLVADYVMDQLSIPGS